MNMRFWCARCGRSYEVPRRLAGRRVRCLACGHVQPIPEPPAGPGPGSYALAPAGIPVPPPISGPAEPPRLRAPSWREHLGEASRLQGLSVVLLTLSAADLFVTFALLRTSPRFYESNPAESPPGFRTAIRA